MMKHTILSQQGVGLYLTFLTDMKSTNQIRQLRNIRNVSLIDKFIVYTRLLALDKSPIQVM